MSNTDIRIEPPGQRQRLQSGPGLSNLGSQTDAGPLRRLRDAAKGAASEAAAKATRALCGTVHAFTISHAINSYVYFTCYIM